MFLRPPFEEKDKQKILKFIKTQSFATLVSANNENVPIASHLPVDIYLNEASSFGITLVTHIANGNPHLPLLESGKDVLIIFLSNSHYISPSWFKNSNSAPTQSHIAVHAYGKAKVITEPDELLKMMTHQVETREEAIEQPWNIESLGEKGIHSRLKQISGIEIEVETVEASFRLLQDESEESIRSVLSHAKLSDDIREGITQENEL